ncbi:tail tube protein [Methylorubrum extorquens]
MANRPRTRRFGDFRVYINTGTDTSPVFEMPCGFLSKSLELSATTGETDVPDCDDPDGAVWTERDTRSRSARVSGQGVLAMESYEEWRAFYLSPASRLVRVEFNDTAANGGGHWQGRAILTTMTHGSGNRGEKLTLNVDMSSDGEWAWTPATA